MDHISAMGRVVMMRVYAMEGERALDLTNANVSGDMEVRRGYSLAENVTDAIYIAVAWKREQMYATSGVGGTAQNATSGLVNLDGTLIASTLKERSSSLVISHESLTAVSSSQRIPYVFWEVRDSQNVYGRLA